MCVWAHRLMGEGRALALTQHPTHTHRELGETDRKKQVGFSEVVLTLGRRDLERLLSRH